MMILSYLIIRALSALHIPTVLAKVLGDGILLFFNYNVQRRIVFAADGTRTRPRAVSAAGGTNKFVTPGLFVTRNRPGQKVSSIRADLC